MRRFAAFLVLLIGLLVPSASAREGSHRWRAVWRMSQVLLAGANVADVASSWGKNEANPLMRTGQRFSYGSLAIKLGALGGSLGAQHYIGRKHPERLPVLATANLGVAAVMGVVAGRNLRVSK